MFNRKGYIGRRMSINAQKARDNGMLPMSYFTSNLLKENGFEYSVDFFKWLCKKQYIYPKEWHHTSASFKSTKYYDKNSITYIVQRCNLELLYDIYLNKIDKEEAKSIRGISYVRIRTTDRIFGLNGINIITLDCVKCDGVLWFAKNKYLREDSKEYILIKEWEKRPSNDFNNKNISSIVKVLLRYKPKYSFYNLNK